MTVRSALLALVLVVVFGKGSTIQYFAVGLGGWLVIEDFIAKPSGSLAEHYATFVTEKDFQFLASLKINAVRIPVKWQIVDRQINARAALDNAFIWGEKNNIKIIVDLHAAPGAQNKDPHSGSVNKQCHWNEPDNVKKTLTIIEKLAMRYAQKTAFLGMELLNEPRIECVDVNTVKQFYADGYNIVMKYNPNAYVFFCQILGLETSQAANLLSPGQNNAVLDIHLYNVFVGSGCSQNSVDQALSCIKRRKSVLNDLNSKALVLVGEWTNEWKVSGATDADYANLCRTQLDTYGIASFGWSF